jgi:hypothetical protein
MLVMEMLCGRAVRMWSKGSGPRVESLGKCCAGSQAGESAEEWREGNAVTQDGNIWKGPQLPVLQGCQRTFLFTAAFNYLLIDCSLRWLAVTQIHVTS